MSSTRPLRLTRLLPCPSQPHPQGSVTLVVLALISFITVSFMIEAMSLANAMLRKSQAKPRTTSVNVVGWLCVGCPLSPPPPPFSKPALVKYRVTTWTRARVC